jgi:hypothetical protein
VPVRLRWQEASRADLARPPPAYVSMRQHPSTHASIRQHPSAYVSIRQYPSATCFAVSRAGAFFTFTGGAFAADSATLFFLGRALRGDVLRTWMLACGLPSCCRRRRVSVAPYASIRRHTSAYVSVHHTSAYVSIR